MLARAIPVFSLYPMEFTVSAMILKQLKIFRSVIINNLVDMMYYFFGFKIPTDFLFHDQTTTPNALSKVTEGMFWCKDNYISFNVFVLTTFPVGIFATYIQRMAFLKWHNRLQLNKAVFRLLTKERLDSFTLLTALKLTGNSVQSLATCNYKCCGGDCK